MAYTARAPGGARTVTALPGRGFGSKRGRAFGPAGGARTQRPAAAATAQGRAAGPSVVPAGPARCPAASVAHVTTRQEDTPACPRGKRWRAWRAERRPRRRRAPPWDRAPQGTRGGGARRRRASCPSRAGETGWWEAGGGLAAPLVCAAEASGDILLTWRDKQAMVRSGWIIEYDSDTPRLTTCYPL